MVNQAVRATLAGICVALFTFYDQFPHFINACAWTVAVAIVAFLCSLRRDQ